MPPQPALPFPGAKLVLKSGFEDGVVLNDSQNRFGQWRQELKGADQGYDWAGLPGSPADFQYLVSGNDARTSSDLKRFIETRIDTVTGRDGNSTKALYQAVRAEGSIGRTQNDFILFNMQNPERGYLRYWIKLQPNLLDLMTENGDWRVLLEWKELPSFTVPLDFQYRWVVLISRAKPSRESPVDGLVWKVEGDLVTPDQAAKGTQWTDDWTIFNRQAPVPLGEWFLFEVQWNLDPGSNSRLLVKANGQVIAETTNRTQSTWPRGKLYLFMNYMPIIAQSRGEAYQWVDDVELWSYTP